MLPFSISLPVFRLAEQQIQITDSTCQVGQKAAASAANAGRRLHGSSEPLSSDQRRYSVLLDE